MKRNLIGILSLVVMSVLLNATVHAQTISKANVPFAFKVGSAQLPAGTYEITAASDSAVAIHNRQSRVGALSMVRKEYPSNSSAKLIFHRLGDQYFLAEIWRGGGNGGMVLPPSKQEKALQKELALAGGQSNTGDNVVVALY